MKKKIFAPLLCLCFFLTCGLAGCLDKDKETDPNEAVNGEQEATDNLPDSIKELMANAEEGDLFVVVTRDSPDLHQALTAEKSTDIGLPEYSAGDGLEKEKAYIIPLFDEVQFKMEKIEYLSTYDFFELEDVLSEFTGNRGDIFSLDIFLTESIPPIRLLAIHPHATKLAVWDCSYFGMGDDQAIYISTENTLLPIAEYSNLNNLSIAAAVSAIYYRNSPELPQYVTPEELLSGPETYWYTLAHALTLFENDERGLYTWTKGEVPCHIVHDCGEAIFPDLGPPELDDSYFSWPDKDPSAGKNYGKEPCGLTPFDFGNALSYEVYDAGMTVEPKKGYVLVKIASDTILDEDVFYRVEWEANDILDLMSPFQYHMTGITKIEPKG